MEGGGMGKGRDGGRDGVVGREGGRTGGRAAGRTRCPPRPVLPSLYSPCLRATLSVLVSLRSGTRQASARLVALAGWRGGGPWGRAHRDIATRRRARGARRRRALLGAPVRASRTSARWSAAWRARPPARTARAAGRGTPDARGPTSGSRTPGIRGDMRGKWKSVG